jgi:hypothetical protein
VKRRLQTVGLVATLIAVLVLAGSMIVGGGGSADGAPARRAVAAVADTVVPSERVRVEVLNGAGVPGLARSVTQQLRRAGFDVVYFGNAPARDSTVVLDRVGKGEAAAQVARALGGAARVASEPDSALYLDVTVVLGRDRQGEEMGAAPEP